jgi:steroid 5-alpha reductase family enzyme
MPIALTALLGLVVLATLLSAVWFRQLFTKNAGMVDPVWSISLGLMGPLYAWLGDGDMASRVLLTVVSLVWGLRLGLHLYLRNAGEPEDPRYRKLREQWGEAADSRMFWFFQAQAVIALVLSTGFLAVAYRRGMPPPWAVLAGVFIWAISIAGEAVADWQLKRFKTDSANAGKTCQSGLWRYSRHPNYFFECTFWLTFPLLAWGDVGAWWALVSPVVMALLLMKLSGVPLAEAQAEKSRADYADYKRRTSALIPWPPKTR